MPVPLSTPKPPSALKTRKAIPRPLTRLCMGLAAAAVLLAPPRALNAQSASEKYPIREAVELSIRGGLPNFFKKLKEGSTVKIAYLGGSITAQNGWRVQSRKWFQNEYPQARIEEIHAAIGGTGSNLGVFRVERDVLNQKPDLLFVEFAVNDSRTSPENIVKAMEGIVRKTWRANPETDICFVYTVTHRDTPDLATGKMKRSGSTMEVIADHYAIPSIHMGIETARLESEGKLLMRSPGDASMTRVSGDELNESTELPTDSEGRILFAKDGVHPFAGTGHVLYTRALIRSMKKMEDAGEPAPHDPGSPLHPGNWENARQIPLGEATFTGPVIALGPREGDLAKRFAKRMPSLYKLAPGATVHFRFKGTKAAVYDLMGPDSGALEVTVDGKTRTVTRFDRFCSYHRLGMLGLGGNLPNTEHEVTLRVLDQEIDKAGILLESKKSDIADNPEKYAPTLWYAGYIFIVGEMLE